VGADELVHERDAVLLGELGDLVQHLEAEPVAQAVVALTVMTLFVPCVANFLMIVREQGSKVAMAILCFITVVAVSTGAGLHYVLQVFGIRF
jgi:Fe2+ transport system protein B